MSAVAEAPVADLATNLERLADLYIAGELDETETFMSLDEMVPDLFGEDLWDAFESYATALRLRDDVSLGIRDWTAVNEHLTGPDKTELAIQEAAERADDALRVLLAGGEQHEPRQEVRHP